MHAEVHYLPTPEPFRLKATALSHGWHECSPMSWSEGGSCLQIIDRDAKGVYRVSVTEDRPSRGPTRLHVVIDGPPLDGGGLDRDAVSRILDRLAVTLSLRQDLEEFYELCADHPQLCGAAKIGAGRLIRSASMTENVVKAICGTNVNWTQAVKMINRICQLGPNVPHFRNLSAWPTPREILRAGEPFLKQVCRLGYRSESIMRFCRDVADGRFDPDGLDQLAADPNVPSKDLVAILRTIPGIGPSSAHYLVGFFGRHDCLSVDSATVAHFKVLHSNGRTPTVKQIVRHYERYGRWQNLVCWLENWLTWSTARSIVAEVGAGTERPRRADKPAKKR